jgi:hypothetical protein
MSFSNRSIGGCSVLSDRTTLSGACVLYVLVWHLMGSAGAERLGCNRSRPIRSTVCYRIGAVIHSLPQASLPLGSSVRPPVRSTLLGYAGLNSAPLRSIACMMMASRRASAIRAFRMVERLAIAKAQFFSFNGPL